MGTEMEVVMEKGSRGWASGTQTTEGRIFIVLEEAVGLFKCCGPLAGHKPFPYLRSSPLCPQQLLLSGVIPIENACVRTISDCVIIVV